MPSIQEKRRNIHLPTYLHTYIYIPRYIHTSPSKRHRSTLQDSLQTNTRYDCQLSQLVSPYNTYTKHFGGPRLRDLQETSLRFRKARYTHHLGGVALSTLRATQQGTQGAVKKACTCFCRVALAEGASLLYPPNQAHQHIGLSHSNPRRRLGISPPLPPSRGRKKPTRGARSSEGGKEKRVSIETFTSLLNILSADPTIPFIYLSLIILLFSLLHHYSGFDNNKSPPPSSKKLILSRLPNRIHNSPPTPQSHPSRLPDSTAEAVSNLKSGVCVCGFFWGSGSGFGF